MKKRLIIACLFTYTIIAVKAVADDTNELQNRLNQVNSFHASFTQQVTSTEGNILQEGEGKLWVKRPNLFNWHMTAPDENIIISDGKTLWFYNPLIEQATANWLKNAIINTPIMLIASNSITDWHQYNVKQQGDNFSIVPKFDNDNLKQFTITVTTNGSIKKLTVIEQGGQRSTYKLRSQNNGPIEKTKFCFIPPKGITIDDQR